MGWISSVDNKTAGTIPNNLPFQTQLDLIPAVCSWVCHQSAEGPWPTEFLPSMHSLYQRSRPLGLNCFSDDGHLLSQLWAYKREGWQYRGWSGIWWTNSRSIVFLVCHTSTCFCPQYPSAEKHPSTNPHTLSFHLYPFMFHYFLY